MIARDAFRAKTIDSFESSYLAPITVSRLQIIVFIYDFSLRVQLLGSLVARLLDCMRWLTQLSVLAQM